ncbi:MAG: cytochrome c3 family protein [Fibrobacteria bacterium]|nr:cytochrome c3 family protein [Fibrobacteria bacterium]
MRHLLFILCLLYLSIGLVLAAKKDVLTFDHNFHIAEEEIECTDCHESIEKSTADKRTGMPTHEICSECHDEVESKDEEDCEMCHSNAKDAKKLVIEMSMPPFSHKLHLEREEDCLACHKGIEKVDEAGKEKNPEMPVCMTCHDDRKGPSDCNLCHDNLADLKPLSHGPAWLTKEEHGFQGRFNVHDCDECHQQMFCDDCHQGQMNLFIHDPNYQYTHGLDVKKQQKNCTVCHQTEMFCLQCHP